MHDIRERGILTRTHGDLGYPFGRNKDDEELIFLRVHRLRAVSRFPFLHRIYFPKLHVYTRGRWDFPVSLVSVYALEEQGKVLQSSPISTNPSEVISRRSQSIILALFHSFLGP